MNRQRFFPSRQSLDGKLCVMGIGLGQGLCENTLYRIRLMYGYYFMLCHKMAKFMA